MQRSLALAVVVMLGACVVEVEERRAYRPPPPVIVHSAPPPPPAAPAEVYVEPAEEVPARAVYVEPAYEAPPPVAVRYAPPPMRYEPPPPQPEPEMFWVGGYWIWSDGEWAWMTGYWIAQRPGYYWEPPYYEHRHGLVIFVPGHWQREGTRWAPPPPSMRILVVEARPGYRGARPPDGYYGCFVPPPPGSRPGLIVPAPVGTPPQVVVSAPPLMRAGMVVHAHPGPHRGGPRDDFSIVAPAGVTRSGQPVSATVPARPAAAAALPPKVNVAPPAPPPGVVAGHPRAFSPVVTHPTPTTVPAQQQHPGGSSAYPGAPTAAPTPQNSQTRPSEGGGRRGGANPPTLPTSRPDRAVPPSGQPAQQQHPGGSSAYPGAPTPSPAAQGSSTQVRPTDAASHRGGVNQSPSNAPVRPDRAIRPSAQPAQQQHPGGSSAYPGAPTSSRTAPQPKPADGAAHQGGANSISPNSSAGRPRAFSPVVQSPPAASTPRAARPAQEQQHPGGSSAYPGTPGGASQSREQRRDGANGAPAAKAIPNVQERKGPDVRSGKSEGQRSKQLDDDSNRQK